MKFMLKFKFRIIVYEKLHFVVNNLIKVIKCISYLYICAIFKFC